MSFQTSQGLYSQNTTPTSGITRGIWSRLSSLTSPRTRIGSQDGNTSRSSIGIESASNSNIKNFPDSPSDHQLFLYLWHDVLIIMSRPNSFKQNASSSQILSASDACQAIINLTSDMVNLLTKKNEVHGSQMLEYFNNVEVIVKLLEWIRQRPDFASRLTIHLLNIYDLLFNLCGIHLCINRQILGPLITLIAMCQQLKSISLHEEKMVLVLHHLSFSISKYSEVLELLFDDTFIVDSGLSVISILLPYVHLEGKLGQQSKDALHMIVSLSVNKNKIVNYIVFETDFCLVVAGGLTGLYSMLPRRLVYSSDDWSQITDDDISASPDLERFLASLNYCDAIIKIAPSSIRKQLLEFIDSGFLIPVIGPALYEESILLPPSLCDVMWLGMTNGMEEMIAASAYLDLFLRRIKEPDLLRIFLQSVLLGKVDEVGILESLIQRIVTPNTRLCVVTLALFRTLVDLNCEDVMFYLVFKYLMPCRHIMFSQRHSITDADMYCKNAQKILSLIPSCSSLNKNSIENTTSNALFDGISTPQNSSSVSQFERSKWWLSSIRRKSKSSHNTAEHLNNAAASVARHSLSPASQEDCFESSYLEYLHAARICLGRCFKACQHWTATYDGKNIHPEERLNLIESQVSRDPNPSSGNIIARVSLSSEDQTMSDVHMTSSHNPFVQDASDEGDGEPVSAGDGEPVSAGCCEENVHENEKFRRAISIVDVTNMDDLDSFLLHLKRIQTLELDVRSSGDVDIVTEVDSFLIQLENMSQSLNNITNYSEVSKRDPIATRTGEFLMKFDDRLQRVDNITSLELFDFNATASVNIRSEMHSAENMKHELVSDIKNELLPSSASTNSLMGSSDITAGPFLTSLLQKLETMKQNTFYVNLHLTGLLTRLACYPQPLLKSFLLSQTLVFQPSIKSLAQVLNFVKLHLEKYFHEMTDKDIMLLQAHQYLQYRDDQTFGLAHQIRSSFSGSLPLSRQPSEPRLILNNRNGARYRPNSAAGATATNETPEFVEKKNAVYCALVFKEFLKELAAISQEHSVLMQSMQMPS